MFEIHKALLRCDLHRSIKVCGLRISDTVVFSDRGSVAEKSRSLRLVERYSCDLGPSSK